jgi:hypothetical protein
MNKLLPFSLFALTGVLLTGCQNLDGVAEDFDMPQLQQNTYLSHAKPPQRFGFSVVPADDGGIDYRGTCRLHPRHMVSKKMERKNIPLIEMRGRAKRNTMTVLIDVSSPDSWMEFSASRTFDAHFMGINDEVIPYRGHFNTGGVNAYAGVVTQLRIDQFFIENVPFYIRMATGSLGPLARGIYSPKVDAILGWDSLKEFEFIQFNFHNNTIVFSASDPYTPNAEQLAATARIVKIPGSALAVKGSVVGQDTPILIDPAGNFSFARGDAKVATTSAIKIGDDLAFAEVSTLVLPTHKALPRIGRKLIAPYIMTICNKEGVVYFETPAQQKD